MTDNVYSLIEITWSAWGRYFRAFIRTHAEISSLVILTEKGPEDRGWDELTGSAARTTAQVQVLGRALPGSCDLNARGRGSGSIDVQMGPLGEESSNRDLKFPLTTNPLKNE